MDVFFNPPKKENVMRGSCARNPHHMLDTTSSESRQSSYRSRNQEPTRAARLFKIESESDDSSSACQCDGSGRARRPLPQAAPHQHHPVAMSRYADNYVMNWISSEPFMCGVCGIPSPSSVWPSQTDIDWYLAQLK